MGCSVFITTNAAGFINQKMRIGDLALITDHINMIHKSYDGGMHCQSYLYSCISGSKFKIQWLDLVRILPWWQDLWWGINHFSKRVFRRGWTKVDWRTLQLFRSSKLWKPSWDSNHARSWGCFGWSKYSAWINGCLLGRYENNYIFLSYVPLFRYDIWGDIWGRSSWMWETVRQEFRKASPSLYKQTQGWVLPN